MNATVATAAIKNFFISSSKGMAMFRRERPAQERSTK